jgi:hypothetical protein
MSNNTPSNKIGYIKFNGSFADWCVANILIFLICALLAIPTLGLSFLYFGYYQVKYFVTRFTIVFEDPENLRFNSNF